MRKNKKKLKKKFKYFKKNSNNEQVQLYAEKFRMILFK